MHLGDGGVIQTHGEYLLYAAGACSHDSRLAKLNKHKLSSTEFENLNIVLKVYASVKIDEFPRTFRSVHDKIFVQYDIIGELNKELKNISMSFFTEL
jgi:hypothetical protein